MKTAITLLATALCAATLAVSQPAECGAGHCPEGLGCNDELPCPGDCGCARRPGQPFGRCVSYDVHPDGMPALD